MANKINVLLVSIRNVAKEKVEGGLGLHDIHIRFLAFGARVAWNMYAHSHAYWVQIMQAKYLDFPLNIRILTVVNPLARSVMCNFLIQSREIITTIVTWEVNNGEQVKFWIDSWGGNPPLIINPNLNFIYPLIS